jgi:hypothetical protein
MGHEYRPLQDAVKPVAEPLDGLGQAILNLTHDFTVDVFPRDLLTVKRE